MGKRKPTTTHSQTHQDAACSHTWERWGKSAYDRCTLCGAERAAVFGQRPQRQRQTPTAPHHDVQASLWDTQASLWDADMTQAPAHANATTIPASDAPPQPLRPARAIDPQARAVWRLMRLAGEYERATQARDFAQAVDLEHQINALASTLSELPTVMITTRGRNVIRRARRQEELHL